MEGVLHESQVTVEYCRRLLQEYSILDKAQIYRLMRIYGNMKPSQRERIGKSLLTSGLVRRLDHENRVYFTRSPQVKPTGRYMAQIICFWVLLEYIDKVDNHHAPGTFTRIAMEIQGRDYEILYVPCGVERLCMTNMQRGGKETKFFVIVENVEQIPLISSEKVHTYATVNERGQVEYYSVQ